MRLAIIFQLFGYILCFHFSKCVEFNRATTGVRFYAYVKYKEGSNNEFPDKKSYTLHDIKTMLEVISTKFSKVASCGIDADAVPYEGGGITYNESSAQVMTAEAAALINSERGNLSLTVLVGVFVPINELQMETEVQLALESVNRANAIYPGTAVGLLFTPNDVHNNLTRAQLTLKLIREVRNTTLASGIKLELGTRQFCSNIVKTPDNSTKGMLAQIRQNILSESDFLICVAIVAKRNFPLGPEKAFGTIKKSLLKYRHDFKKRYNPNIVVMGQTYWSSKGENEWENIDNLQKYWVTVDKWAKIHNFTMWLYEAIDNPWKESTRNVGWWKLRSNAEIASINGYIEKIYEPPEAKPIGWMLWFYIGVGVAVAWFGSASVIIYRFYVRVPFTKEQITKKDIQEFMCGITYEAAVEQAHGQNVETILMFPYNKSYEFIKKNLKIQWDALLGSGQFGGVFRATIGDNEKTEVALKMAKYSHNIPKNIFIMLLHEIKTLAYLGTHPNIVSLKGAYTAELGKGILYMATELCSLGSLEKYLRKVQTGVGSSSSAVNDPQYENLSVSTTECIEMEEINTSGSSVTLHDMLQWSYEIARGMEYLGVKQVIHANLSTKNVFLMSDKTAKITGFGFSQGLQNSKNYDKKQEEPIYWRWMALESLKRLEFSAKSDVWSYGVTLWEIFSLGALPYPGLSWSSNFPEYLLNGFRMQSPLHAKPEIYSILVDCWHTDPTERPSFTDLKISTYNLYKSMGNDI